MIFCDIRKSKLEKWDFLVLNNLPLIQDERFAGAITHVLIGDPTTGYGIFIENMLANIPEALVG